MFAKSARNSCPTSSATAANTSSDAAPRATSVATRRNAACSSASRAREARLSAFAIAVATSSVNEASRASVSAGSSCSRVEPAAITPHRPPSTMIGVATAEWTPICRAVIPTGPETSATLSTRAERPVCATIRPRFFQPGASRRPTGKWSSVRPDAATVVTVPSDS